MTVLVKLVNLKGDDEELNQTQRDLACSVPPITHLTPSSLTRSCTT